MKKYIMISICTLLFTTTFQSCKEDKLQPIGDDTTPPGAVTLKGAPRNIPGGAVIWFNAPTDPDLLYVKAEYKDNRNIAREVKVSGVLDSLVIIGFGAVGTYTVTLYAVDRNENASIGVPVEISPLTSAVEMIRPTLTIKPDYGGITVSYENESRSDVSLNITVYDSLQRKMVYRESFYTSQSAGSYSFRGYNSVMTRFGVYVEDRWGNLSDTLYFEGIPIPDEYLDKSKFRVFKITNDTDMSQYGFTVSQMWDEVVNSQWNAGHSVEADYPRYFTLDLGQYAKLSRFKLYQRTGSELYKHGNPKHFKVYGTKNVNELPPYDVDDPCKGWTFLKECFSFKPSGLPVGQTSAEDLEYQIKGEDFVFDINTLVEIRYVRFEFLEPWESPYFRYVVVGELSFWGEILSE